VLHRLSHGDVIAKPDVARLASHELELADGTFEELDVAPHDGPRVPDPVPRPGPLHLAADLRGGIAYLDSPRARQVRRQSHLPVLPRRNCGTASTGPTSTTTSIPYRRTSNRSTPRPNRMGRGAGVASGPVPRPLAE
jgi:hypothetical protein